jgi:hypothetical protein
MSKPQSSKYKKCAHCGRTNHATKYCWFNPENKGKPKLGKKNLSATDKNVLVTQKQFNAILERLPRDPKTGKRKVRDFTPEDSDAELVEMFSPKTTTSTVDTKDVMTVMQVLSTLIYILVRYCHPKMTTTVKRKTKSQKRRSRGRSDRNRQTRHRSHFARHWSICNNNT